MFDALDTNESDLTVGSAAPDAFGAVRSTSGATTPFGYMGAPQSGELVHLKARDLKTGVGRFWSTDPVRPGAPGCRPVESSHCTTPRPTFSSTATLPWVRSSLSTKRTAFGRCSPTPRVPV